MSSYKVVEPKASLATLTERVAHLPSKSFIVASLSTMSTLLGLLVLFADQLRALIAG